VGGIWSTDEGEGASWMWIEPTTVPESFGQNLGAAYDDSPSTVASCNKK
jgi:hypothetical protein